MSFDYKAKRFVRGGAPAAARAPPRLEGDLLAGRARRAAQRRRGSSDPLDVYRARYAETEGAEELARLQDVDLGIYLVDDLLVKTDRASMAHSLEARVPFLDPVVAELALALPTQAEGARPLEEAAAAQGGRAAAARARSSAAASRASRSRPPPGCAATSSRSPATSSRPRRSSARASRPGGRHAAARRPRLAAGRTSAARSGACSPSRSGSSATPGSRPRPATVAGDVG